VILTITAAGIGVAALAPVRSTAIAAAIAVLTGTALGYGNLLTLTWIQGRIPPDLMGRVMSLLITGSVGLVPVSVAIAGAAVEISLEATMLIAGVGMALLSLASLLSPAIRNLGLERLASTPPEPAPAAEANA
jgi:hypothetical protein